MLSEVASIRSNLSHAITGEAGQRLAIGQRNIAFADFDIRLPNNQRLRERVV